MEYAYTHTEDIPVTDLSEIEDVPPDHDIRAIGRALGCQNLSANVWYFQEGEEIQYHAHAEEEELFYVLDGRFSVKLGRSGEEEIVELDAGSVWAAGPMVGHGHRCLSEEGTVLAIGAPNVQDPGLDPHELSDEEIDEALEGDG